MYKTQAKSIVPPTFNLRSDVHYLRKLWHMGTGLTGLVLYYVLDFKAYQAGYCLFALAIAGFIVEFFRLKNTGCNKFIMSFMRPFMRECEKTSISGLPFYALGVALAIFFYEEKIAVLSTLFLIFADPISSLVGILHGRDKIFGKKSLQGSLAGFATCYFLSLFYGLTYTTPNFDLFFFAVGGGIVGSLSELFSVNIDDNLTIPVLSGLGLTLLNMLFPVL